jgi:hypothetical protein
MKTTNEIKVDKVLVVHCKPLDDQWECDCERTPLIIVPYNTAKQAYDKDQYEWYAIKPSGALNLIKPTYF